MTMPYDKGETEPGQDMHVDLLITLQTSEHCSLRFDWFWGSLTILEVLMRGAFWRILLSKLLIQQWEKWQYPNIWESNEFQHAFRQWYLDIKKKQKKTAFSEKKQHLWIFFLQYDKNC